MSIAKWIREATATRETCNTDVTLNTTVFFLFLLCSWACKHFSFDSLDGRHTSFLYKHSDVNSIYMEILFTILTHGRRMGLPSLLLTHERVNLQFACTNRYAFAYLPPELSTLSTLAHCGPINFASIFYSRLFIFSPCFYQLLVFCSCVRSFWASTLVNCDVWPNTPPTTNKQTTFNRVWSITHNTAHTHTKNKEVL